MIIRISDIPVGGRELTFDLDEQALNARVQAAKQQHAKEHPIVDEPAYYFQPKPQADIKIEVEGSQVFLTGLVSGSFSSTCARCAEEASESMELPVTMILKSHAPGKRAESEDEDISLGYYMGDEVDCSSILEEHLILALPYRVLCRDDCKGLCPQCGVNLNVGTCSCRQPQFRDDRFKVLEKLKIQ